MKTKIILLFTLLTNLFVFSQSQFQNIGTSSTGNAERVSNFSVTDATNELLEITNSTNIDGQFIPSLWAHHQADNRYVFRHFITTNTFQDNGNSPMMIYRAEIRNNLNLTAGPSGDFPWGTTASNVVNRPLFAWENGNTQLMRILANGFVGIGTTTPTSLFHTNGTVRFENIPTTTTNTYVLTTDINGNVSRQLASSLGNSLVNNCNTTNFIIKKGATDFTCSQIFDNGIGVGIGTVSPTSLFHTNGTLRFQNLTDSTSPFKILGTDNSGNVFEYNPSELSGTASNDYDWLKPDGSFPTSINDDIYTNGNIGINVTNPTASLNTNGTLKFENLTDSTSPFKILGTDNSGNVFEYNPSELSGTASNDYDWLKPDGSFPTSINDDIYTNGNIGINVTNPTASLNTNGTLKFENLTDSTSPFKILGTDNSGNVFEYNPSELSGTASNDYDWLKPDGSFPTSINDDIYTNGNIGINVTNPTASLNTNGTLKFENLTDSTSPFKILGTDNSGNVFEYNPSELSGTASNDYDWLKPDGSFPTSINDDVYTNGKVGINTNVFPNQVGDVNVSSYSLFAKGGILTEEVRVALSSEWADFVFDKEYKLEPLKNVEKFITENKHLKDVPSAKEVEKNGIELGEMNKILLLKIEELTLYLIEMNKKIESQNAEIEKLKLNEK